MDGTPAEYIEGLGKLHSVKRYLVNREVSSARMEGMMREGMRYVDHAREAIHEANTKMDNCEKALEWISDNRQKLQVENRGLSNRNLHLENVVDLQETKINALEEQNTVLLKQINELEKQLAQGSTSPTQEDPATLTPEIEDEEEEAPQDYSDEEMAEEDEEMIEEEAEEEEDPEERAIVTPDGELLMIVEDKDDTPTRNTRSHKHKVIGFTISRKLF